MLYYSSAFAYPKPMSLSSMWITWKARPRVFSLLLKWLLVLKSAFFGKKLPPTQDSAPVADLTESSDTSPSASRKASVEAAEKPYYNARLDPTNYLEGPLSTNAATRLRQLLARPGIIVNNILLC